MWVRSLTDIVNQSDFVVFFFFSSRRRHTRCSRDWSSDVCSSDLARTMRHLDEYLLQLETAVEHAGGQVHWARDAAEANRIITELVQATGADQVVKVKSLTTDEIRLNNALEKAGIRAIETDLAELIIQLAGETSSHILVPAIHKNRSEIRDLFRHTIAR